MLVLIFLKIGFQCLHTLRGEIQMLALDPMSTYLFISPSGWGTRGRLLVFCRDQRTHFLGYRKSSASLAPLVSKHGTICWAKQGIRSLL